jgi:hypothetical protein
LEQRAEAPVAHPNRRQARLAWQAAHWVAQRAVQWAVQRVAQRLAQRAGRWAVQRAVQWAVQRAVRQPKLTPATFVVVAGVPHAVPQPAPTAERRPVEYRLAEHRSAQQLPTRGQCARIRAPQHLKAQHPVAQHPVAQHPPAHHRMARVPTGRPAQQATSNPAQIGSPSEMHSTARLAGPTGAPLAGVVALAHEAGVVGVAWIAAVG